MNSKSEKVVVFGYSENPERYSFKAYHLLLEYGHTAIKFNPREEVSEDFPMECDTVTLYMSSATSDKFSNFLLDMKFKRIIVNPGAENPRLEERLSKIGVEVIHGCTLVMLKTDQF